MKYIRQSFMTLIIFTIICGVIYPLAIYGVGQLFFAHGANGSLIEKDGQLIGSTLIGQQFTQDKYFWSRPSATANYPYNALASGGSNLGPLNPILLEQVKQRAIALRQANTDNEVIPVDLVTASGSGLDPDISLAAANYQAQRIANTRHVSLQQVQDLINKHAHHKIFGFFGEASVNVLELNLALDKGI